ncbi:MAG: hypothetical protein PUH24_05490 [Prevotellaceae bacterium]|nr:hypothetical protein [Prevotellaceae bacterium]MDY6130084.1 hypothetical protein [Prevotella sp.]
MNRLFIIVAALMLFCIPAHSQMTPEAIMEATPDLPSVAALLHEFKEHHDPYRTTAPDANPSADFMEAWRSARRKIEDAKQKFMTPGLRQNVMDAKVGGTNKTSREVSDMSESEVKSMAMSTMKNRIGALGLSQADLAKLQSGNLSEAETKALAGKVLAAQTGGLTEKDIEAMSNMTEEQRKDFMQESGLGASISAKMGADKGKRSKNKQEYQLITKLQALEVRIKAVTDDFGNKKNQTRQAGYALYERSYKARIADFEAQMCAAVQDGALEEKPVDAEKTKAANARFKAAHESLFKTFCDFYGQYIPMWRNHVTGCMDDCRSKLLPLLRQKQDLQEQLYALTRQADYALSAFTPIYAGDLYFELAEKVVDYELEFTGLTYGI